ncbi:MAG: hypothetical protein MUP13_11815, partial [Thermoanaerobaculales bacterium]|nr:hypothetical protein [Thermoanaerobaculales bacterium]
ERLDTDIWDALIKGGLRFRITASVISDEKLSAAVADGPVDSVVPVIKRLLILPRQFKYCKVSDQSIFVNSTDPMLGVQNEVDDSEALYEFVRQAAKSSPEVIETAEIQTPYLVLDYRVGDKINTSPESRDLLSCRRDNRSQSQIAQVASWPRPTPRRPAAMSSPPHTTWPTSCST